MCDRNKVRTTRTSSCLKGGGAAVLSDRANTTAFLALTNQGPLLGNGPQFPTSIPNLPPHNQPQPSTHNTNAPPFCFALSSNYSPSNPPLCSRFENTLLFAAMKSFGILAASSLLGSAMAGVHRLPLQKVPLTEQLVSLFPQTAHPSGQSLADAFSQSRAMTSIVRSVPWDRSTWASAHSIARRRCSVGNLSMQTTAGPWFLSRYAQKTYPKHPFCTNLFVSQNFLNAQCWYHSYLTHQYFTDKFPRLLRNFHRQAAAGIQGCSRHWKLKSYGIEAWRPDGGRMTAETDI